MILVLIGLLYWFFGTELGCSIRATGGNDRMAKHRGSTPILTVCWG